MASNNQGIMHLAYKMGGLPVCKNQKSIMSTTSDRFEIDTHRCKRCEVIFARWQAKRQKTEAVA